jgi:TetR/AcrR family transcriptional regulator
MATRSKARPRRSPGRPAAGQDFAARERLIDAATGLFAERGVAATTFALIAGRAGLTPAMMHYYFRDRDHLLDAVTEERLAPLIASVWGPVEPGTAPAEIIRGVVNRMLEGIDRMPWVPSTWMREVLNEGGLLRSRIVGTLPLEKVRLLSESVAGGQASQIINEDIDPVLTVFSTLGLVMMHMATIRFFAGIFHREPPDKETICRHVTALLLNGLQPQPSGSRALPAVLAPVPRAARTSTAKGRKRM